MAMNVHPTTPAPFPFPRLPRNEEAEKEKYVVGTLRLIGSDERSDTAPTRKKLSDHPHSGRHAIGELLAYFNDSKWRVFQANCEGAGPQLEKTLENLEKSQLKSYVLGQENKKLQDLYRTTIYQVDILEQESAVPYRAIDRGREWRLAAAIHKVGEVGVEAARVFESSTDETSVHAARLEAAASLWGEAYYFLWPVVTTGWGILNKLGVFAEALTKNVPIVGGLISLMLTIQQRVTVRLKSFKTEDRDQLINICNLLTTSFKNTRRKQFMERIDHIASQTQSLVSQAELQTQNTARVLQHTDAVHQEIAQLRQENALFKEELSAHFKEKLEQIIALLTNQPLPTTPPVDKRA